MSCQPTGNPQGIWRLLVYYRMLLKLLDTYFSGYLMVEDDGMARNYTRLCSKIRGVLEQGGLEHLADKNWQPYPSLRTLTSDDVDWDEWTRSRICGLFLSEVEEEFVNGDEKDFPLSDEDERALGEILAYISSYAKAKAASEAEWLRDMQRRAEKARALPQVPPGARVPLDFAFVMDSRLRELLIAYWTEAESAMKHGLHTSAVLLCGSVVEAILVDALSHEPDKAKFDYYQKYLEGKDKSARPPEIAEWGMFRLVEICRMRGIIKEDAAKLSHVVRDYRNLVHLHARIRDGLRVHKEVAAVLSSFLAVLYRDVAEWHGARNARTGATGTQTNPPI